jgi:SnoaL-like domain
MADQLQEVADRLAVQDAVTRMAVHADRRDWEALTGIFADQVRVDYSALTGGAPSSVAGTDLVAGWAGALGGYQATQHLVANHLVAVDGDTATATATFQATHHLPNPHGGPLWTLGGTYRWELVRDQDAGRSAP